MPVGFTHARRPVLARRPRPVRGSRSRAGLPHPRAPGHQHPAPGGADRPLFADGGQG